MNHYSELLNYIKEISENDEFVHTVTRGNMDDLDLEKFNIYPLVHLDIIDVSFTNGQTVKFNVEIACLDIRDINNEIIEDKFWNQDNEVDNHNVTHAILNRLWTIMYRDFEDREIRASENPVLEKITYGDANILDGWMLSFEVEMPNTDLNLCR